MIDVYYAPTPNGVKIPIALEELGAPYRLVPVNLGREEQKQPEFLALNPNGRIPVIVDPDGPGGEPVSVFESGAILLYLADKFGGLMPSDPRDRIRALEYLFFQVGGVGPMFGQAGWFMRQPERITVGIERYQAESRRLTAVLETRLQEAHWLAGESFSVADIAHFGWLRVADYAGVRLEPYPAVQDWLQRIASRPAVQRAVHPVQAA
ncbi:glutathione S-transferase family protein [Paucibacter sp. DJ2R-2]|uniref:glutathione S-transferase family protein n=1 Tax=Paucibacter sp. DJ2R-2 TaxID=2893558 RepID=UPI0021E4037F|nr:glutathione binding-like protein [Paucibacter sp. DJ2R-2]MCV2419910.1 glutathione binding-like protein [Paucibacter sp. DJ4R-1]MCV2437163.1 glutathione binding-like protein [Paucibacter sp. DJ2R-2]